VKTYILRGACAGVIAALATAVTLLALGEPSIRDAIALEEAAARASGEVGEDPMFSRTVQVVGGSIGVAIYGLLAGTIFGIVFAAARHHLGRGTDWARAMRLAGLGFLAVYLVPFLKYPANPPAVGDPDTVNERTIAYLGMMALAIIATALAVGIGSRLRAKGWPQHLWAPAAVGVWLVAIGTAYLVLPANPDEIAVGAKLIWRFRLASLAGQGAFWAALGCTFGWLSLLHAGHKVFATSPRRRTEAPEETVTSGG
jgi:hypothetical protein